MKLDHDQARNVLLAAIEVAKNEKYRPSSKWAEEIREIVLGTHLTYRYILVTGLLGKATNVKVNSLTLQAGSKLVGAYDARSLCHHVLVPVEREFLDRGLGGSNEPFLNKPARFPEIALSNAVRKGKDAEMLARLHTVLSKIERSEVARQALSDSIFYIFERSRLKKDGFILLSTDNPFQRSEIIRIANSFISQSIEGQTVALLTGVLLDMHYTSIASDYEIKVHPVNQSGASSKEVSDIDIKKDGKVQISVEVKDKDFLLQDVDHAVHKIHQSGLDSLIFVKGPRGRLVDAIEEDAIALARYKHIDLSFFTVTELLPAYLWTTPDVSVGKFIDLILQHGEKARVKDEVVEHLKNLIN